MKDSLFKNVEKKTNINKDTIMSLAKKLQSSNFKDEKVLNEVTLYPYLGQKGLTVTKKACFFGEKIIPVDIYFPAFHGEFGEDGCIQGLFELAGVPYVGSGVLPSAIAMSKNTAKTVVSQYGIPVLPSVTINKELVEKEGIEATKKEIFANNTLKYPVFIKPNNLGSSIGVSKATNDEELLIALTKVFKRDKEALIEPYMDNMFEINISVLDTTEGLRTSVVEIPVTDGSFLSYEDKYLREGKGKKKGGTPKRSEGMASLTRSINPVDLDEKIKNTVSEYAKIAYKAIKASGVGRIDFMYDKNSGTIYLNEFNLIPGSLSFYLWEKSDPVLLYTEELTKMIDRTFEVYSIKQELDRDTGFKAL